MNDLRSSYAEQTTQVEGLSAQIREMQGRIDELEFSQKKRFSSEVDTLKNQVSNLRRRVPPPSLVPTDLLEQDEVLAGSLEEDSAGKFTSGLQFVRDGVYEQAITVMQEVLDANSGKNIGGNALFWLGISYEGLSDSRNAMLAYNQIMSLYPKHPYAPPALFRLAGILEKINDTKNAQIFYKKLVADYSNSKEASLAREKIKKSGE